MPLTPPVIEQAALEDAVAIARLMFHSHTVSFKPFASAEWVASRQLSDYVSRCKATLGQTTVNHATFVARVASDTVGTVRVAPLESPKFDAQLTGMHVSPELTGGGIGTLLMHRALEFIREQKFQNIELGVIAANTGARRFYESHGWALEEELPNGIEGVPIAIYRLG